MSFIHTNNTLITVDNTKDYENYYEKKYYTLSYKLFKYDVNKDNSIRYPLNKKITELQAKPGDFINIEYGDYQIENEKTFYGKDCFYGYIINMGSFRYKNFYMGNSYCIFVHEYINYKNESKKNFIQNSYAGDCRTDVIILPKEVIINKIKLHEEIKIKQIYYESNKLRIVLCKKMNNDIKYV